LYTGVIKQSLEGGTILPISVMDEILTRLEKTPGRHRFIAGYLLHPSLVGVSRDTHHMHPSTPHMDEKQHVVRHQSAPRPDFGAEEIGGDEDV
jgi:hypothetical protein